MPDSGAHGLGNLRSDGPTLSTTALRSTKAGLGALCIVSFALATFGPWFNLLLAYGLMVASMAVAVAGIWWADRAAHETHRDRALRTESTRDQARHSRSRRCSSPRTTPACSYCFWFSCPCCSSFS